MRPASATPMQPIARYSLEPHEGPYERWPLTSRLCLDGVPLDAQVPGYVIEAQYDTPHGVLLVNSFDCPFEESNAFVLLDPAHRIVAQRELLAPYASWLLDAHWPEGPATLALHYHVGVFMRLDVLPPRRFRLRRARLRLRRVRTPDAAMRAAQARLEAALAQIAREVEAGSKS